MRVLVGLLPFVIAGAAVEATPARKVVKPQRANLPAFDFKGYVAGAALTDDQLQDCKADGDKTECKLDTEVAGISAPVYIDAYKKRMTRLNIVLLGGEGLGEITLAFMQKYGATCENKTEPWTSAGGTSLKNTVMSWCFKTGKLTVKQYGPRVDVPLVQYSDEYSAPVTPPKVDF
jgi:hypothetical protein